LLLYTANVYHDPDNKINEQPPVCIENHWLCSQEPAYQSLCDPHRIYPNLNSFGEVFCIAETVHATQKRKSEVAKRYRTKQTEQSTKHVASDRSSKTPALQHRILVYRPMTSDAGTFSALQPSQGASRLVEQLNQRDFWL
jgi:hypothetical protein